MPILPPGYDDYVIRYYVTPTLRYWCCERAIFAIDAAVAMMRDAAHCCCAAAHAAFDIDYAFAPLRHFAVIYATPRPALPRHALFACRRHSATLPRCLLLYYGLPCQLYADDSSLSSRWWEVTPLPLRCHAISHITTSRYATLIRLRPLYNTLAYSLRQRHTRCLPFIEYASCRSPLLHTHTPPLRHHWWLRRRRAIIAAAVTPQMPPH